MYPRPSDTILQHIKPPPPPDEERVFTAIGAGHVGTGRTPEDARRDLMEKIRHSGEL